MDPMLLRKIKDNLIGVIIVAFCVMTALKIHGQKQAVIESIRNNKELEQKKNEVLLEISGLERSYQELKERVNKKAVSSVINSLNKLAKGAEVKITQVRPAGEVDMKCYKRYPFELSVAAANYHKLGVFVSMVESSPDLYTLENVELAGGGEQIEARMTISTVLIN